MINVAQAQAALKALEGDEVVLTKVQYSELLLEISRGNAARISLTNARSILNAGAGAAGLNA